MSNQLHKVAESFCRGTAVRPEDFVSRLCGNKAGAVYVIYDQGLKAGDTARVGHKTGDAFFHFNHDKLEVFRVNSELKLVEVTVK